MKKLLIMVAILMFATTAWAVDVNLSGDYTFRGSLIDNDGLNDKDEAYTYYNQDMNVLAKFIVDDTTSVTTRFRLLDYNWEGNYPDDDMVGIERAWMDYKVSDATTLSVGLMNGATWATAFGDDITGRQRVKVVNKSDFGVVLGVLEKFSDPAAAVDGLAVAEDTEWNNIAVGFIKTVGDISVKPLLYYLDNGADGVKPWIYFILGLNGNFGDLGFESEYYLQSKKYDDSDSDTAAFGLYVNGWMDLDPFKVGAKFAYGSTDDPSNGEEVGFDFDDDFDLTLYLSDWAGFGGGDGITGMTALQGYVDWTISDELSASGSLTLVSSNWDTGNFADASATEIDGYLNYKLTDSLTYCLGLGMASIEFDVDGIDDVSGMRAYHKLALTF